MLFVVFPCYSSYFIFVFNFCWFDYYVSQCVPPWVYPAWDSLCFLDLADYFLSQFRQVFSIISSNNFLGPFSLSFPSGTPILCLMLSQRSPVCVHTKSLQSCLTLCDTLDCTLPGSCPWDCPGKNTGVGCHASSRGSSQSRSQTCIACTDREILYRCASWDEVS